MSRFAADRKNIQSPIVENTDVFICPNIEAANIMFRAMLYFGQGQSGGVVVGAKVPLVLLSRAESAETKIQSIAIALLVQAHQRGSRARHLVQTAAWRRGQPPLDRQAGPGYSVLMKPPVLNRDQTAERLGECADEIRALGVVRLALFGSILRGQPTANSDIDLLVQFAPGSKSYSHFMQLSELLEAKLGRPVELVTLEALSPVIGPRILAEAQDVLRAA